MKDIRRSQDVCRKLRLRDKTCYECHRAIVDLDEYAQATYVEGFAVFPDGDHVEHGWLELDGLVIDPRFATEEITYFPGLRFIGRDGIGRAFSLPKPFKGCADLPIFYRFGFAGNQSPEFRKARADALKLAMSLHTT